MTAPEPRGAGGEQGVSSVEPGCTCGGMAACPQCQERDAADRTSPERRDVGAVAEVLAAHRWRHTKRTHCACGWRSPLAQLAVEGYERHVAELVAQALAADREPCPTCEKRDQEFGNLRWMDGHQQGLKDAAADREPGLREAEIKAEALREAAEEADKVGHHWSGAPALAFFALAGDLRDRANRLAAHPSPPQSGTEGTT